MSSSVSLDLLAKKTVWRSFLVVAARNTKEPKVDDIPNQGGGLDTLTKISSGFRQDTIKLLLTLWNDTSVFYSIIYTTYQCILKSIEW